MRHPKHKPSKHPLQDLGIRTGYLEMAENTKEIMFMSSEERSMLAKTCKLFSQETIRKINETTYNMLQDRLVYSAAGRDYANEPKLGEFAHALTLSIAGKIIENSSKVN